MATIILLARIKDTKLDDWQFFLQPNTVVSVLSVISKTLMLAAVVACLDQLKWIYFWKSSKDRPLKDLDVFDEAVRGPWGALKFPVYMHISAPQGVLASLVIILAFFIGPFTQQVISFSTSPEAIPDGGAAIPISRSYDDVSLLQNSRMSFTMGDAEIEGAIYRGSYSMNEALDFSCPSSNCEWADFTTLAVCSTCEDVTAADEDTRDRVWGLRVCRKFRPHKFSELLNCTKYNFTTPRRGLVSSAVALWNMPKDMTNGTIYLVVSHLLVVGSRLDTDINVTVQIARFPTVRGYNDYDKARQAMAGSFQMTECLLTWCLKEYSQVRVINGAINSFSTQDIAGQFQDNSKDAYTFVPDNGSASALGELANGTNAANFTLNYDVVIDVCNKLLRILAFNISTYPDDNAMTSALPVVFYQSINNSGIIHDIAASMTDRLRHSTNGSLALGMTMRDVTFIRIVWPWMALPVASVALSAAVLLATICDNCRRGAPLWKSGLIPLLFHGLEGWSQEELRAASGASGATTKDMDKVAKRMFARLQEDDAGDVRFVRA